ncbi:YihY/virulence factor BrkB family protein [Longispora albida]|uniref:YihY/virulence factor BrkB family protein n=1 Tax=Longispora albida TaxID=203523 RepID=UPI00035FF05F|nr:YihY/virulence factor BrkB family protein [Longispora albida]
MRLVDQAVSWWDKSVAWARQVSWFDHLWRTKERFADVHAGRMAAAISYYGFFATFSLALLAFSIFGFVLDNPDVVKAVEEWLAENLPFLDVAKIQGARNTVGIFGLVGFLLTGIGWVEAMRASIRAVWLLDQNPGNYFIRRGVDIVVLIGLGLLLAASIGFSVGAQAGLAWLRDHVTFGWLAPVFSGLSVLVAVAINWFLAAAMLTMLPRLKMPLARWLPAGLVVAVGLELLKTVGQFYITRVGGNPAYQVVAGTVGLLVFLNLFSQLLLWGSTLAATSSRGVVRDLAAGPGQEPIVA